MKYRKDPPVGTSLLRSVKLKFASHALSRGESLLTSLFKFFLISTRGGGIYELNSKVERAD